MKIIILLFIGLATLIKTNIAANFNESCTNVDCDISLNLYCDPVQTKCVCNSGSLWSNFNRKCMSYTQMYLSSCTKNTDCKYNFICYNKTCICADGLAWNGTNCVLCPSGWLSNRDKCYYLTNYAVEQLNASLTCASYRSHLVIPSDVTEMLYLASKNPTASSTFWAGVNDKYKNYTWVTQTGEPFLPFWRASNPDHMGTELCVEIASNVLNAMNNAPCTGYSKRIHCEKGVLGPNKPCKHSGECLDYFSCINGLCICNETYSCFDPCHSEIPKCGVGAICKSKNDNFTCTCPAGKIGDPFKRCCKMKQCGCWGDPHCHSFDKSIFHFQGICQYNFVSTINTAPLPYGLVPFNVYTKQENRNGVKTVAYIRYVEANINGTSYRLLQKKILLVNGIKTNVPYKDDNGVRVFITGGSMSLNAQFGLTIVWDGYVTLEAYICDAYAGYINGLCGNADGNGTNDFSDPQGNLVPLVGDRYNQYWNWGNTWRVFDNSGDNHPQCNVAQIPINDNPLPVCRNTTVYQNWCSYLNNTASIWQLCIKNNTGFANSAYDGCVFDLCATEGNSTLQEQMKCTTYAQFNQYCSNLGFRNITWRSLLNCPITCGTNEIFAVRKECPKTCLDITGTQDCGEVMQREECYCQTGYVLNNNQQCILPSNCGCLLPDGSSTIASGQSIMSNDCSFIYTCGSPMSNITIKNNYCQNNSSCKIDQFSNPNCVCNDGYIAQGNTCIKNTTTTATTTTPTTTTTTTTPTTTTTTTPTTTITTIPATTTTPTPLTTDRIIADTTIVKDKTSTSHVLCEQSKTCYGYGDPHYRTSDGYNFIVKQNCSYLFASDDCLKTSTFQIVVHQKYKSDNSIVANINSIDINYNQINYSIDSSFHINNIDTSLPYSSQNNDVNVYNFNHYTVFKTDLFELKFDGKQFLKFSHCNISLCGLCGIHDTSEINNYVMKNPEYCF